MKKERKTIKETHGGARPGAGRPNTGAGRALINFRAPAEDIQAAKKKYGRELNGMFREWLKAVSG